MLAKRLERGASWESLYNILSVIFYLGGFGAGRQVWVVLDTIIESNLHDLGKSTSSGPVQFLHFSRAHGFESHRIASALVHFPL